eukprot:GILK01006176.1.p1 GENE.GILK01006176.1~~GILK01006176.1.p1  ORF type:complete len:134 (-),score=8.15 GILK01006176.1:298-699(-)
MWTLTVINNSSVLDDIKKYVDAKSVRIARYMDRIQEVEAELQVLEHEANETQDPERHQKLIGYIRRVHQNLQSLRSDEKNLRTHREAMLHLLPETRNSHPQQDDISDFDEVVAWVKRTFSRLVGLRRQKIAPT